MQVVTIFIAALISGISSNDDEEIERKEINLAFFLDERDEHTEIAIRNSLNIMNYFASIQYSVQALIYRTRGKEVLNVEDVMCEMMDRGVAAIFGPQQQETNEIIESMSSSLQIPQFQISWNPHLETFSTLAKSDKPIKPDELFNFNLYPSPYTISKAFATLVRENDWKSYTIIYENDDGLIRLQEVLKAQPKEAPITYEKLGAGPDHRTVLKEVVASGALHIILDCDTDHIIDILLQAKEVKLFEEYHSYILTSLNAHTVDFTDLGEIKANMSFMNMLDEQIVNKAVANWQLGESYRHKKMSRKPLTVETILIYDALNLFITSFSEVDTDGELFLESINCQIPEISQHGARLASNIAARNLTRGLLVGPISGPIAFNSFGLRSSAKFHITELTKQQFRVTGTWNSDNPNEIHSMLTSEDREKERYQQLKGKTFKVVSRIYPPYLSHRVSEDGKSLKGNDAYEGYSMDLIDGICEILNCSYVFELVPDGNYGKYDSRTKRWNGLIGYLLDRKADLAICDLTTTYERRKAVDFTNPFMTLGISILYSKIVKEPPELLAFTNPLHLDVWLYMATGYVVMSMIIFLVARINPHEWENPHPCNPSPDELENIWNMKNCFWLTLGSIMAQGCDILPKGISTRMVVGMWWFFSLIMTACYTANLAAFLTQDRMGLNIQSAEDLASQTKIKYGCLQGGSTASFFEDTNVTTYHKMWVQMVSADPSVFEKTNDDGVKRVISSKGKYAFLMESSSIEYEMERHCEVVQVGNKLDTKGYGIAMPTNAPYRTALNQAILKMQESGKLHRLKTKWWKEKNKGTPCKKDEAASKATATELGLGHVGGVFVVLAGGITVAFLIAIVEFLWSIRKIAVSHHVPLKEAFIMEMRFVLDIWSRQKAVNSFPTPNIAIEELQERNGN